MRPVLIACAILCVLLAVFIGLVTFFTSALEGEGIDFLLLGSAVVFLVLAVLSSFGASVIYWLEMQVKTMKELHSAIVASATGEEPSLPTVEDNEVPEHIVRAKYEDDMAGRTLFKPKP